MERLQAESEEAACTQYYALANSNAKGVNFDPEGMPRGLETVLDVGKYKEIICTINDIIQRTAYSHKKAEMENKHTNPLYVWLMGGLILIISVLLVNSLKVGSLGKCVPMKE